MGRYKYTLSEKERNRYHLVVSKDSHDVMVYYAKKWGITITEATQRILAREVERLIKE